MNAGIGTIDRATAVVMRRPQARSGVRLGGAFEIVCIGKDGREKWRDGAHNIVLTAALQHILDVVFSGGSAVATWYVGLINDAPTLAAADTSASHAGWTEFTAYDEATRVEYSETRTNQTESNSAAKAAFTISTNSSVIAGAFLISNSTKSGSTGTLLCEVAFTGGDKSADDGDTLQVTYTFAAADDGA
jgi:hypothetical protein